METNTTTATTITLNDVPYEIYGMGRFTIYSVINANKREKLQDYILQTFQQLPTEEELNDWLWYDQDIIYQTLDIPYNPQPVETIAE